ncbi:hypothetical protein [Gordonia sp. NPDC003376]
MTTDREQMPALKEAPARAVSRILVALVCAALVVGVAALVVGREAALILAEAGAALAPGVVAASIVTASRRTRELDAWWYQRASLRRAALATVIFAVNGVVALTVAEAVSASGDVRSCVVIGSLTGVLGAWASLGVRTHAVGQRESRWWAPTTTIIVTGGSAVLGAIFESTAVGMAVAVALGWTALSMTAVVLAAGGIDTRPTTTTPSRRIADTTRQLREGDPWLGWVGLASLTLLVVILPCAIVATTGGEAGLLWLWVIPLVVMSGGRLAWLVRRGERRLYEMTFWVFTYVFMGLAPLAQIRERLWPETVPRSDWTLVPVGSMLVLVGCGSFVVGALIARRLGMRGPLAAGEPEGDTSLPTVSYPKLVVLSLCTVLFNVYYLSKIGYIQFTQSRSDAFSAYDVVWQPGSLGILVRACTMMGLLITWVAWMKFLKESKVMGAQGRPVTPAQRRMAVFCAVVLGVLLANTMNPISNARYLSGTAILAATVAFGWFATPQRFRVMTLGFVSALVMVFPMMDAFRYTDNAEFKAGNPLESLLSADYDSFAQILNGVLIADRDGIAPGRQFIGVLFWWMPRVFWADKPVDTGIFIANGRGYQMTNLSAPLWIEIFLNGGWVVLIVVMALIGYCFYRWDSRIEKQMKLTAMPPVISCVMPFYLLILLRGSLLQAMSYMMFIVVFAVMVARVPQVAGGPFNRKWLPGSLLYADRPTEVKNRREVSVARTA